MDEVKNFKKNLWIFLIKFLLVINVLLIVWNFVMSFHIARGNRMHPYIMDGDLVVVFKLGVYHTEDVVLYRNPNTGDKELSRIVAIGENEVDMTDYGELLINGSMREEKVFYPTLERIDSDMEFPYQMSRGGYFVLDDYRTIGNDSRLFGDLGEADLIGTVVYVFRRRGI